MPDCDLAVIGTGVSGLSVGAAAAQLGLRVVLIDCGRVEENGPGTGGAPGKALMAAARAARDAVAAKRFGVHARPEVDWAAVQAHVRGVAAAVGRKDGVARFAAMGVEVIAGEARFVAPDVLAVGGRRLTARRIVVATGGRAKMPAMRGLTGSAEIGWVTAYDLPERPDHLLVLGGGPEGLEMAQAFASLGSRVTLLEAGQIAAGEDRELAEGLLGVLAREGIDIMEGAAVSAVEPGPVAVLADGRRVAGSHLLVAHGCRPDLEGLGLEAGNVRATPDGIATDAGLRSLTNRRVYAVGAVADPAGIGLRNLGHVGDYDAGIIVRRMLFRLPARADHAALPRVILTAPELAQVGMTEAEARMGGHDVRVLRWPIADTDRALAEHRHEGLVKLVVDRRGRVLGVGILAAGAGEMLGAWTLAIARGLPLSALAGMAVPYPTLAEAPVRAARSYFAPRLFDVRTKLIARLLAMLP